MDSVITDFSHYSDEGLDAQATTIIADCSGNANFVFTGGALNNRPLS